MELLSTWRTLYKLRYCPVTLIQTAFSAGTVYLLIAMQASSGTRVAQKELRHSLDQETLVQQYLQEIGSSWNCATNVSNTLRKLRSEQVGPLLDSLDRKSTPTTGLQNSADIAEDEERNESSLSRSSSRKLKPRQFSHSSTMSSGSGQSSLSNPPNHILTSSTSPSQVPPPANPSNSPIITISSAASPIHATPSAPIAIQSQRSTSPNPSSFTDSWSHQPSPGSSPNFNYLPSFAHRGFHGYSRPLSNYMDNPFSGNGNGHSEDVAYAFGGQGSAHNVQPSSVPTSRNLYVNGYLGMMGGQTISEEPAFVGLFSEADTHSPNFSNFPVGTSFLNHGSTSLGEHVASSSYDDNDSMDLDNIPWRQS
jgi:hypothetical protein